MKIFYSALFSATTVVTLKASGKSEQKKGGGTWKLFKVPTLRLRLRSIQCGLLTGAPRAIPRHHHVGQIGLLGDPYGHPISNVTSMQIFVLCVCWAYVWNREIKLSSNPVSNKAIQELHRSGTS
uniref:Uncharacterized protein n=1 Tax=Skeletonema marinoi TaxID=267567 RepID=A0A7S2LVC9_9STRA